MAEATSTEECVERHVNYPYDVWRDSMDRIQRQRLKAMLLPIRPGESVLDVGCNSGYIVEFLPATCRASGVDVSPELAEKASERLCVAEVAPAEQLPFPDRSFDVVVLGEVLEHVYDPAVVMKEAARVARRLIVGSTPHEDGAWGAHRVESHPFHVRCFTHMTLLDLLSVHGRVVIETVPHIYVFEVHL